MPRPEICAASPARRGEDGHFHMTGDWKDQPMPIYAGEHAAVSIALETEDGDGTDPVTLKIQVFSEDGQALNNGSEVTFFPGQGAIYDFGYRFGDPARIDRVAIRVHEVANPENATELAMELYCGDYAQFNGETPAHPATEDQIAALQAQAPLPYATITRTFCAM